MGASFFMRRAKIERNKRHQGSFAGPEGRPSPFDFRVALSPTKKRSRRQLRGLLQGILLPAEIGRRLTLTARLLNEGERSFG